MAWVYRLDGPLRFARHDVEMPSDDMLAEGQVLLRFLAGGVCGSDIARCMDGTGRPGPQPDGWSLHEIVGEIVATRSDLRIGSRVVGWVEDTRGLREYVPTAATMLLEVPGGLDDASAAPLQPLACVLHALSVLGDLSGARAAVIGLGPIGLLFAHALKDRGASVVGVDRVDRSDVAAAFGLDQAVHSTSRSWARAVAAGGGFDLVVEAVGHQVGTMDDAIAVAAPGGTILYFGNPDDDYYPIRFGTMMDRSLTLRAGRTPRVARRQALISAADYITRYPRLFDRYITHVLPVTQAQTAFEMASRPTPGQLKIVLQAAVHNGAA
ncbi:MAG TPA: zinc-binding dehydrogenase [Euzebyales bacterium]|nr:zinc-binding dehydrogenase [Euzebyales bacterium]